MSLASNNNNSDKDDDGSQIHRTRTTATTHRPPEHARERYQETARQVDEADEWAKNRLDRLAHKHCNGPFAIE